MPEQRVAARAEGVAAVPPDAALGHGTDDDTKRYLKDKIRSAESFIRNVDRRKDTVSRITEIILEVQREFFEDGKGPLRPLRLEDVAVELGVHLSTVSRGVTGKYMATPYGLFELKHFFSRRLPDLDGHGRRRDDRSSSASGSCVKARTSRTRSPTSSSPSCCRRRASPSPAAPSRSTARSWASSPRGRGAVDECRARVAPTPLAQRPEEAVRRRAPSSRSS